MKKSRIIRMLSEVIEDKQTGKQFWFDLDLYKHERDWPKPLSTKDICTKMELNTTYEFRSEEALMKRIKRFNNYVDDCKSGVMGDISFIKSLGLALAGDEMKFLIPILPILFLIRRNRSGEEYSGNFGTPTMQRQIWF